jgi:hypothetical protein
MQMAKDEHFRLDIALEFDFLCLSRVSQQIRKVFGTGRAGLVSELSRKTVDSTIENFVRAVGETVEKQSIAIAMERGNALANYKEFSSSLRALEAPPRTLEANQLLDGFVNRLSRRWQVFEENPTMLQEAAQAAGSLLGELEIEVAVTKLHAKSVVAAEPII